MWNRICLTFAIFRVNEFFCKIYLLYLKIYTILSKSYVFKIIRNSVTKKMVLSIQSRKFSIKILFRYIKVPLMEVKQHFFYIVLFSRLPLSNMWNQICYQTIWFSNLNEEIFSPANPTFFSLNYRKI